MNDYSTFNEFFKNFNETIEKTNLCMIRKSEFLTQRETRNYFFDALNYDTRRLLVREGIESLS